MFIKAKIDNTSTIVNSKVDYEGVVVYRNSRIQNSTLCNRVTIGDDSIIFQSNLDKKCTISRRNIISRSTIGVGTSTQGNTTIRFASVGKYCAIAWNVTIGAPNHDMHRLGMAELDYIFEDEPHEQLTSFEELSCCIGNDVWVAAGAHVLRNVHVADGAVIAANAVVTKDVPPYAIVGGIPAKIIGYRFNQDIIESLLRIKWWDFTDEQLKMTRVLFNSEVNNEVVKQLEVIRKNRYISD